MTHLFLFTIGPVQGFIAQARKTRDLYAGSQILSELIAEGLRAFKKEFPSGKVIFPNWDGAEDASLPNRFIGRVEADPSELKAKAVAIQQVVEEKWMGIAEESLKKAGVEKPSGFDAQIEALLDIHWVFNEIKTDYAEAYEGLERLGGAVKNIRSFEQYQYNGLGESGRKCSLDGEANALFYRKRRNETTGRWELPAMITHNKLDDKSDLTDKFDDSEWSEGEALGAVGTVKRLYKRGDNRFSTYPSTTIIALQKQLNEHKDEAEKFKVHFGKENLGSLLKQFDNVQIEFREDWKPWNDQYYYEENLTSKNIPNSSQLKLVLEGHKSLTNKSLTKAGFRQEKYYAVIRFDGDKMGEWLSGKKSKPETDLEAFHTTLSNALAEFSKKAKEYLDKSEGKGHTVYAGGDDFLGFVNIHHLFEVMKYLRQHFDEIVNQKISAYKKPGKNLTFSAGIVIAHYKMPFSEVLKKAKAVEKAAKDEGGRNAFGIAVMKHSGEVQEAVYKWDADMQSSSGTSNWEVLEKVFQELDDDKGNYSNTFIRNLTSELCQLTGKELENLETGREYKSLGPAIPWEIKRLVGKSLKDGKKEDPQIVEKITQLWKNTPKDSEHQPRHFIHALHIADFLTRKITKA